MNRYSLLLALLAPFAFAACDSAGSDDDEGEAIVRVTYTLTPTTGGSAVTASFNDANRNGVIDAGEVTGLSLVAGRTYTGTVAVFGLSGEITSEIAAEKDEHAFVYTVGGTAASRLSITSADNDANGLPFRQSTSVAVSGSGAAAATVLLELVHFGSESAKEAAAGVASSTHERDVSVTIPVTISAGT